MPVRVYADAWAERFRDQIVRAGGELHALSDPHGSSPAVVFRTPGFPNHRLPTILKEHPDVQWVHTIGAGVDTFLRYVPESLVVTRAPGPGGVPVAEFALTALLLLTRRIPELFEAHRDRRWHKIESRQFADTRVVILGWGPIAREIAWRCQVLHMDVRIVRQNPRPGNDPPQFSSAELTRVTADSDALIAACALTPATHQIVDADVLSTLGPTGLFVNVGRGGLVDQDALIRMLNEDRLGGAVLDVMVPEPLPPDHDLWTAPRCLVTSHLAAHAGDFYIDAVEAFCENLHRLSAGEPLLHVVDRSRGY